ncbi:MAG: hypothetical protein U0T73_07250 [Chitinophagales bacterium]
MKKQPLFLIDAAGALFSAVFLLALMKLESIIGMPPLVLQYLLPVPVVYAAFSFTAYWCSGLRWPVFLRVIAVANIVYGLITWSMVLQHAATISKWGALAFAAETFVIIALSVFEWKTAGRS